MGARPAPALQSTFPRQERSTASPHLSVIVVSYNAAADLDRCLRSLLAEQREDREIVVVDNGSTDGSPALVRERFPAVRLVENSVNRGFGSGANIGARLARGTFLAFLNQDTTVEPGWADRLVDALRADPTVGLATSKILLRQAPDRINTCGNDVHCSGLTLCRGAGQPRSALAAPATVAAVSGAAFAIRRDLFQALGGFDESFFLYLEDTDLSLRAQLAGYTCAYVPSSVVYHDYTLRFGPEKTFLQERNRYQLLLKTWRVPTLLALLPAIVLAELVTWGFVLLGDRAHLGNKLRAYGWLVRHLGDVLERRRQAQTLRRVPDREIVARCSARLAFEQTGHATVARLAHAAFDPLFFAVRRVAIALV